jgi:hypothetical protein
MSAAASFLLQAGDLRIVGTEAWLLVDPHKEVAEAWINAADALRAGLVDEVR